MSDRPIASKFKCEHNKLNGLGAEIFYRHFGYVGGEKITH